MSPKIEIYTDGACSGNPGRFATEAAKLRGRVWLTRLCRFEPNDSARDDRRKFLS